MLCEFQKMREGNPFASADETIVAGVNAWKLAQSLREAYGLAAITIAHVDRLEAEYKKLQERTEFNAAFGPCGHPRPAASRRRCVRCFEAMYRRQALSGLTAYRGKIA
jgi:hypothetical protein